MGSPTPILFINFDLLPLKCSTCPLPCYSDDNSSLCVSPPPPPAIPVSTAVHIQHKNALLSGFLIAAGALLALSFLLFLTFYAVLRRRRRRQHSAAAAAPSAAADEEDGEVTHHVWLISTVGLDDAAIASIAAFAYKPPRREGGGDCAVCLGEFKDGEMVKLLPRCAHAFHVSCVDTWLRSHVSCPLCRAPVLLETDPEADSPPQPINSPLETESGASSSSAPPNESVEGLQPVRRSVSMDAASLASLLEKADSSQKRRHGELELSTVVSDNSKGKMMASPRKEKVGCVVMMKRSQSTRSGRFFFPRYGRGRSSSVLPL